jgi:sulfonate transport system permease protein
MSIAERRPTENRRGDRRAAAHDDPMTRRVLSRRPGAAERDPVGSARSRARLEVTIGLAVPVALLMLWQVAAYAGWIDKRIYPAPDQIAATAVDLARSGLLWDAFSVTAYRVLVGWSLGVASGVAAGVAMGSSRWVRKAFEPTLDALYVVPKLALLPVFINLFGLGEGPKIALVVATVFFFVWISTMTAVMTVPGGYHDTSRVFGAGRWRTLRHVVGPAILPQVFVAMRVAAGVAALVIVAAEYIVGNTGLGYLIFNSRSLFLNDRMYVGIVVVALFGVAFAEVVRRVGRWVTPWAPEDQSTRDR